MKNIFWMTGMFLGFSLHASVLRSDTVYFLDNRPEVHGKLTLNGSSIHVEGSSTVDVKLSDVLEADFTGNDFHLDYFSSEESPAKLPAAWMGQEIGPTGASGSYAYANGALTLSSSGADVFGAIDKCYFLAQPWSMDEGQWTMRIKERSDSAPEVGFMLRTALNPGAPMFAYGLLRWNGFRSARAVADTVPSRDTRFNAPDIPGWIRLTRYSNYLMDEQVSSDGKTWIMSEQDGETHFTKTMAGLFVTGNSVAQQGKLVVDHITFAPCPAQPSMVRPGVLLRSGSFLAGEFSGLDAKGGSFNRSGKNVTVNLDQISSVVWQPTPLQQITELASQSGLLMKNGDFMLGDLQNLSGAGVQMTSVIMGPTEYVYTNAVRAYILHPLQPRSSDYEIRLKDGSAIRATGLDVANGQLGIHEVSGVIVTIDPAEITQMRAGSAHAGPLIGLPWKATAGVIPDPIGGGVPKGKTENRVIQAGVISDLASPLQCWQGPNQEQIMALARGTVVEFPLVGKFRAVAMRIAVLSDVADAQTVIRFLADGKVVGRTLPFKAGDQPRWVEVALQNSKSVSVEADSSLAGTKVLLIDAVAIRQ